MIAFASGVRVWIATGHTDMRRGMQGLALQVQEGLKRNPHAGDLNSRPIGQPADRLFKEVAREEVPLSNIISIYSRDFRHRLALILYAIGK